jgi:hypothetical protein
LAINRGSPLTAVLELLDGKWNTLTVCRLVPRTSFETKGVKMSTEPDFDLKTAHKFFSAACFNMTWDLMDKAERTPEEDEQMIRLTLASHWHWTQRDDYADTFASVAHWQTSRVYAIIGEADNARKYGELSLERAQGDDVPPFYLGYAYEALARAESVAGDSGKTKEYLRKAREAAAQVEDEDTRKMLLDDLDSIG